MWRIYAILSVFYCHFSVVIDTDMRLSWIKHTGDLLEYILCAIFITYTKSCFYRDSSQQLRYAKTKFEHSRLHGSVATHLRESGHYNNSW